MRVAFCGGGTGGHVYPALTVANALKQRVDAASLRILYVGVKGRIDKELVERDGIDFKAVTARPLRVGSAGGMARGGASLSVGTMEAYRVLRRFRPEAVFATGGYGSVAVGLAAKMLRRPLLLFLPDVEAGMAVRMLARVADCIAITAPPAADPFPSSKVVLTGYPVRPFFYGLDREKARASLGLHPGLPTVVVSGASSGANRINRVIVEWAPDYLRIGQLVHLCGRPDEPWVTEERRRMPDELRERYHVFGYLHDEDMARALAAADVGIARSGASTLGELPAVRLPAVLIPGEYEGWDQGPNARYLAENGAAIMLPQSNLKELPETVMSLLADSGRRQKMEEALARLAMPDAAERLAAVLQNMARQPVKVEV
jgi:UDP-N-acetylglucosamine--N-acetylmuramyl-(pentapeptide) pyrophosphoryl-undecaprenol N-acetylglucosamine transferase